MMRGGDWRSAPLLPSATRGTGSMRSRRGPPLPVIAVVMLALMTLTFFVFQVMLPDAGAGMDMSEEEKKMSVRDLHRTRPTAAFCELSKATRKGGPMVCWHGGDTHSHAPNTIAAVKSAIAKGARCVEIDASLSLDAVVLAVHDREVIRMSGDENTNVGFIKSDRIMKYDAAKGLPASVSRQGATVPQLKDVVAETAHLLDTLIIDVKEGNRHRAAKVAMGVSIVLKAAKCNNCVVWSKSDYVTNSIKDNYRDIAAGEVMMNDTKAAIKRKMDQPFRMPSTEVLSVHHSMLDADLVEQARSRGMRIFGWTANEPYMQRRVLAAGADAVVTNEPEAVRAAADAWHARCGRRDDRI